MGILNKSITLMSIILIDIYLFLYAIEVYGIRVPFSENSVRTCIVALLLIITILDVVFYPYVDKLQIIIAFYAIVVMYGLYINGLFSISRVASDLFFPLILFLGIRMFLNKEECTISKVIVIQCIALLAFFLLFIYASFVLGLTNGMYLNSCYYSTLLLPFALCVKKTSIRNILMLISVVPTLMTAKRGAFLSVVLGVIVYFIAVRRTGTFGKQKKRNYLVVLIVGIGVVVCLAYLNPSINFDVIDRLKGAIDDGGSGRLELYASMINLLCANGIQGFLIGHGSFTSASYLGLSSHNDLLEMLWSYGLLGFMPYIIIVFSFFKTTFRLKRKNSKYYGPCCAALVAFIICSAISQLVFVPTYVAFLLLFFAVCRSRIY